MHADFLLSSCVYLYKNLKKNKKNNKLKNKTKIIQKKFNFL